MRTYIIKFGVIIGFVFGTIFWGCLNEKYESIDDDDTITYGDFDFATIEIVDLSVLVKNADNEPIQGVYIELFTENPLDENNQISSTAKKSKAFQGVTSETGLLQCIFNILPYTDSIYVVCNYIGVPYFTPIKVAGETMSVTIGGDEANSESISSRNNSYLKAASPSEISIVNGFYVLGGWNSQGVPDYLENVSDRVSNDFLSSINASLPEGTRLPDSHPQYLNSNSDAGLILSEDAEAWVTFVHEGAGWRNVLGYYTYPLGSPPATKSDIRDLTVIFPNVSYRNSGGGLRTGNKVQLHYLNPQTNTYTQIFPANTVIGWFIVGQGWNGSTVGNGVYSHYSDIQLNLESDASLKKHNVLLYDEEYDVLLLGFEDIRRDQGSDQDFNDAVFYTTITPSTAVNKAFYQSTDTPQDSDGDGVSDTFDAFPNDSQRSFKNSYPSENEFGTLVFEDLWPYKGDYDFNDLVIDYNFSQVTNTDNLITALETKIVVKAIGASFHNGFGISLNVNPQRVSGVEGQRFKKSIYNVGTNGTENGQSKATIIYFDDAYNNLTYPGVGIGVNTSPDAPYAEPDTQYVNITFDPPVSFSALGTPPYNPFMVINEDRGIEVHLPNHSPTDLANANILGTGHDNSDPGIGKYYVSDTYLPWAINLPVSFEYPKEKEDITKSYLMLSPWAKSIGYSYMDWYNDLNGYRDDTKIYSRN